MQGAHHLLQAQVHQLLAPLPGVVARVVGLAVPHHLVLVLLARHAPALARGWTEGREAARWVRVGAGRALGWHCHITTSRCLRAVRLRRGVVEALKQGSGCRASRLSPFGGGWMEPEEGGYRWVREAAGWPGAAASSIRLFHRPGLAWPAPAPARAASGWRPGSQAARDPRRTEGESAAGLLEAWRPAHSHRPRHPRVTATRGHAPRVEAVDDGLCLRPAAHHTPAHPTPPSLPRQPHTGTHRHTQARTAS